MKLLLTSAGIKNTSIHDALVELLGKPIAESDALCIPTAGYGHPLGSPGGAWRFITGQATTPMCELGWKSLGVLELTALPSIDNERWVSWVQETDVLLVNGGDALYLCPLDAAVRTGRPLAVAARGLGGAERREHGDDSPHRGGASSAGSRPPVTTARWAWSTSRSSRTWITSSCRRTPWPMQKNGPPSLPVPGYAIDDQTAIKVTDGTVEVVSEGHWRLFTPNTQGAQLRSA